MNEVRSESGRRKGGRKKRGEMEGERGKKERSESGRKKGEIKKGVKEEGERPNEIQKGRELRTEMK